MHWEQVLTPDGRPTGLTRCPRHATEFATNIEHCSGCMTDPGPALEDVGDRPLGEQKIIDDAAEFRDTAGKILRLALTAIELDENGRPRSTAREWAAVVHLVAEYRKLKVDASKLEAPVHRRDHVRAMKRERARMRRGPSN